MSAHDPYIVIGTERHPFAWDVDGAFYEGPTPQCPECGELLCSATNDRGVPVQQDRQQRIFVECWCGERFPVEQGALPAAT